MAKSVFERAWPLWRFLIECGFLLRRQRNAILVGNLLWLGAISLGFWLGDRLDLGITARPVEVSVSLWWAVFSNNASVALIVFAGVLTLGVATIAFTLVLGLMTGASLAQAMASSGWGEMTRHVLPHGWIELPAIGVAVAAGIVPLTVTALALVGRERPRPKIRDVLADSLGLLGVSLVLLLIAATIETLVST